MPMTPFMGVRISWLMLARNSDLSRTDSMRRIACLFELRGDLVALGDVTTDADHADNLAAPIAVRRPGRQVGPLHSGFGRGHQLAGGRRTSREDLIVPLDDPPG